MKQWWEFIHERYPQILYLPLAGGIVFSGAYLNTAKVSVLPLLFVFVPIWFSLFLIRLQHDAKDAVKDKLAFPQRPIPSGKISGVEARKVILFVQIGLFVYSEVLWVFMQEVVTLANLCLVIYCWLDYKDFFVKHLLIRYPLIKSLLNAAYVVPMAFLSVAASQPERIFGAKAWGFAAALYGANLVFHLCKQLNPHLHPVLATFFNFYGFRKTYLLIAFGLLISFVGANLMNTVVLLGVLELIVLASVSILFYDREQFKAPELAATVSLVIHAWAGIF